MCARFPASARLKRPSEYVQALKGRRIARGALFVVNTPRSKSDTPARLGLIIPKRLAQRAVTRNTIKRVIRENFRQQQHQLLPRDYVFRLHSKVPDLSLRQLKHLLHQEVSELLERVQQ